MSQHIPDMELQSLIQAYFAGDLDENGKQTLDQALRSSAEARKEFEFSKRLSLVNRNQEMLAVGAMLKQIAAEEGLPPQVNQRRTFRNGLLGLAGLLMVAALYLTPAYLQHWPPFESGYYKDLVSEYVLPLEDLLYTPDDRKGLAQLDKGMEAYNQGNYSEAITLLNYHLKQTNDANAALYIGISHLMSDQAQKAVAVLEGAIEGLSGPAQEAARWYLALARLKLADEAGAAELLQLLQSASGIYAPQARELLKKLE